MGECFFLPLCSHLDWPLAAPEAPVPYRCCLSAAVFPPSTPGEVGESLGSAPARHPHCHPSYQAQGYAGHGAVRCCDTSKDTAKLRVKGGLVIFPLGYSEVKPCCALCPAAVCIVHR